MPTKKKDAVKKNMVILSIVGSPYSLVPSKNVENANKNLGKKVSVLSRQGKEIIMEPFMIPSLFSVKYDT